MRILMLGWEFPPFISGGLGTACYGLTKALDRLGHEMLFVLPKSVDADHSSHVTLLSPEAVTTTPGAPPAPSQSDAGAAAPSPSPDFERAVRRTEFRIAGFEHTTFVGVPGARTSPYPAGSSEPGTFRLVKESGEEVLIEVDEYGNPVYPESVPPELRESLRELDQTDIQMLNRPADYGGDVVGDAQRYARLVVRLCRDERFDVIHAHDWMTYPAGMAIARITGKPLVTHIHSTEFDRSGEHVNQALYDFERRGMHAAIRVVAVSMLTKNICVARYGIDPKKIEVVYNGVESGPQPNANQTIESRDKIVLFLGRITMQKGPEYFVASAKRVLEKIDNVKFFVAGSGDMARRMIELAADMGIGHKVLFTGFLRGKDVARVFRMADCYVMPSVSEPFGIAPLEAMSHDVPVIISKQSGVSEVLTHALKVDFWDTDEMANKIVAVLRHPPLRQTLSSHGKMELRKLTWDGAAERCARVYQDSVSAMSGMLSPMV